MSAVETRSVIEVATLISSPAAPDQRADASRALDAAARHHGFFGAVNLGVDVALIDRLASPARAVFSQSEATKMRLPISAGARGWRGYFPLGGELTSTRHDWRDGFYLGRELGPEHPHVRAGTTPHGVDL